MSISNPSFSFRIGPSTASTDATQTPERQLKRLLIAEGSDKVFADTRRQLTAATRKGVELAASAPLFQDLRTRFADLASSLDTQNAPKSTVTGDVTASPVQAALAGLQGVAQNLNDINNQLQSAVGPTGALRENPLLRDISDAVSGLFKTSTDGGVRTLGDLGFALKDGQITADEARQQFLAADLPDEIVAAAAAIATQQVQPLAQAAQQAITDELGRAPLDLRLAQQNVHARAEISRLQDRQSSLMQQESALRRSHNSVQSQRKDLEQADNRLTNNSDVHVPPRHEDLFKPTGRDDQRLPPQPLNARPALLPLTASHPATSSSPAGVLSFGLGSGNP